MLVLARQRDQTVMIGDDIEVTVVDIRGDKVRLGVNAPRSVSVHRKEVYDAIRRENESAARVGVADVPTVGPGPTAPAGRIEPPAGLNGSAPAKPAVAGPADTGPAVAAPVEPDEFMRAAIAEARRALAEGGMPIGSVLVRGGEIIARGHDQRVQRNDPLAHAEVDCLARAGRLDTYRDTVLYSTQMPCYLCGGAVVQLGVPKVVAVAAGPGSEANAGGAEFMRRHGVEVVEARDPESAEMLRAFAAAHPADAADVGVVGK